MLNHWHEISLFNDEIRFFEALRNIPGAELEVFGDVGVRPLNDKIDFAVFRKVFVDSDGVRLASLLGVGIDGEVLVLNFDELERCLRSVFVLRRHGRYGLTDIAHFALGEKWLVFDRLAVVHGASSPVTTATTPGNCFAFSVLILFILAWALVLKRALP